MRPPLRRRKQEKYTCAARLVESDESVTMHMSTSAPNAFALYGITFSGSLMGLLLFGCLGLPHHECTLLL